MPMQTVGQRLMSQAAAQVTGRDEELAVLGETFAEDGPVVVYVYGLGGIGKSTLLGAYTSLARARGATVALVDCGAVEPTERGLLMELAGVLGGEATLDGVLARTRTFDRTVLVLDSYERFRLLDTWIRQTLLPALPASARLVVGSREAPPPGWDALPGGAGAVRRLELGPLPEEQAVALLMRGDHLNRDDAQRLNRFLRGHPLGLRVAQAAAAERPGLQVEALAVPRAVEALTRVYLDDLDAATRRVMDAASTIRRTTMSLLAALLPDLAPQDAFDRLRALPFARLAPDGLHLHDTVREVTAEALRATDPVRYRAHRRAAWGQLRRELAEARREDLWRYTADLLYLLEQPVVREAFFPSSGVQVAVEPARPKDAEAIRAIVERHDRPGRADALLRWWERLPQGFSVGRGRDGEVVGFDFSFEYRDARRSWLEEDPLTARWLQHLREDPIPRDQLALFNPRWLDLEVGERPAESQAAFFTEMKRTYLELRPRLRRLYLTLRDLTPYAVVAPRLGFRPLPGPEVEVNGVTYHSMVLDFGPGSVDAWLSWLIGSELGSDDAPVTLDPSQQQVRLDGQVVELSPLEFGVLSALLGREGRALGRVELLESVWGTAYTGGSNVVDAVVRTLRRKLGRHAELVETVRGVGYRAKPGYTSGAATPTVSGRSG